MYGIPAFRRQKQENQEFQLGYIGEFMVSLSLVRSYLLKKRHFFEGGRRLPLGCYNAETSGWFMTPVTCSR